MACLAWVLSNPIFSQDIPDDWEMAKKCEQKGDYALAAAHYRSYLKYRNNVAEPSLYYSYAHCLRYLYEYKQAEKYYSVVWQRDSLQHPDALYYMALMKKQQAEYDVALALFQRYSRYQNGNPELSRRIPIEIHGCSQAIADLKQPVKCEIEALPKTVNSPYSEFNARLEGNALYFSAMRPVTKNENVQLIRDFYRAQIYSVSSSDTKKTLSLPKTLNHPQYHTANFCFNPGGNIIYFTRSALNEPAESNSEIWMIEFADGKWQKARKLPLSVNCPNSVSTQPFATELEGKELLYFVSNREGGQGGMDIWFSFREDDGGFTEAVNAGPVVNSPGNEMTPYYHSSTQTLYFSSDWYAGMGGYDIFAAQGGLSAWQPALRHLPPPLNSPANDVYFVLTSSRSGYFASNRQHAYALSEPLCCNDIYSFALEEKERLVYRDTLLLQDSVSNTIRSMLPLILYFHNDEPNPRSLSDTTIYDYETTWRSYMGLQDEYEKNYSAGFEGVSAEFSRIVIRRFFEDTLQDSYNRLQNFFALLRRDLEAGHRVIIRIDGHASPLHTSSYNMKLSSRRIQCLWNSLYNYNDGFFRPYIKNGYLVAEKNPLGKNEVHKGVSDNPEDKASSVYSVEAALERRIQISQYLTDVPATGNQTALICIQMADTVFRVRPLPDAGDYFLSLQIKNSGEEKVVFQQPDFDKKQINLSFDKTYLNPNEYLFVNIKIPSESFVKKDRIDIVFNCESKGYTKKCRFVILLAK